MAGVLLQKLLAAAGAPLSPTPPLEPNDELFKLALLKLSIFMYHANDLPLRLRYRGQLPHAADLRALFVYRQDVPDLHLSRNRRKRMARSPSEARSRATLHSSRSRSRSRSHSPHPAARRRSGSTLSGADVPAAVVPSPPQTPGSASSPGTGWIRPWLWWPGTPRNTTTTDAEPEPVADDDEPRASLAPDVEDDPLADPEDGDEVEIDVGLRWRLDNLIGQGVVGLVYRGVLIPDPPAQPVPVAVKHLHLPSANPHLNTRNFEQLIAALSLVDHPNIVSYYGSHVMDEDCFLFMDYCEGGTLADWIRRNGPMADLPILAHWIKQMVQGLAFMHAHGIVHRDVKPSNIMLKDGVLKIADFSSSKLHGLCCRKVHDARVVGTPSYLAPEIVAGNQTVEIKGACDIWSLGATIYELILGKPPFSEVDNVWSLYFILGKYAGINIPPPRKSWRLQRLVADLVTTGWQFGHALLPTSPTSSLLGLTSPSSLAVPTTPAPDDPTPPISGADGDADDSIKSTHSEALGALLGHPARPGQQYRYTSGDAVGLESAQEQNLVMTPADEVGDDPLAAAGAAIPDVPPIPPEYQASDGEGEGEDEKAHHQQRYGYVVGRDARGLPVYKWMEPMFPMVPGHHPLLSQLCQTGHVDPLVLDFVERCLAWDPRKRATAQALLAHPLIRHLP
ncbi:Suppressor of Sensor Kinase (SLN1) [Allomyces arbusculus]|nr:Suppressor of Sensor Kinase (SLN1) [Allomyces arbusculus]